MKRFSFTKMNGAGNDFILFDKKINPDIDLSPIIIKKLCERRVGIGADGILVISDIGGFSFDMSYFNADGSTGSLCANGARCAILYGHQTGRLNSKSANFIANKEKYSGELLGENIVKFNLNAPKKLKLNFKIKAAKQLINASYVDTGSPHVVINIRDVLKNPADLNSFHNNIDDFPVVNLGKEIRYHKDFIPEGTNVNFIELFGNELKIRSYERGVENETHSCGTGSVASAIVAQVNNNFNTPITLNTRSADKLVVDFKTNNQKIEDLSLTGPAVINFNGEITI